MQEGKIYRYDDQFSDFIAEVKNFITREKAKSWEVTAVETKLASSNGEFKLQQVKPFNEFFHAKEITEVKVWTSVNKTADEETPWEWDLKALITADGKSHDFPHFDGFNSMTDKFNVDELKEGYKSTFTIEYTADEDKIDISAGNFVDNPATEMKYFDKVLSDFENDIALPNASVILKNLGFDVKPEWLSFKEAIWLETNQAVTDDLVYGNLGAGKYHIKVTVEANTLGTQNNIVGKMVFIMALNFKYGDLNTYDNKQLDTEIETIHYDKFIDEINSQINEIGLDNPEYVFVIATDNNKIVAPSDLYDSETNEKFTKETFNNLPDFTKNSLYICTSNRKWEKIGCI